MVYKKYIKKDGKKYGPYLYENERINGKVVTRYVGKGENSGKGKLFLILLSLSFLLIAIFLFYQGHPELFTGKASGDFGISQGDGKGGGKGRSGGGGAGDDFIISGEIIGESEIIIKEIESIILEIPSYEGLEGNFNSLINSQNELINSQNSLEENLALIDELLEKEPFNEELLLIKEELEILLLKINEKLSEISENIEKIIEARKEVANELIIQDDQKNVLTVRTNELFKNVLTPQLCKCKDYGECEIPYTNVAFTFGVYRAGYGLIGVYCECSDGSQYYTQQVCKLPYDVPEPPEPPENGGDSGGESPVLDADMTIATISEGAKEIIFYQSPPSSPSHCYNLVRDLEFGETYVDCGGECRKCAVWKEKRFPWFWWILTGFIMLIFVSVIKFPLLMTRRYIYLGNNSLKKNDFHNSNKFYNKLRNSYDSLSSNEKEKLKQLSLKFLLEFRKNLIDWGFNVNRSDVKEGKLPEIIYERKRVGLSDIENTDLDRIKRLILNGRESLINKKFKEAYLNYKISKKIYASLSKTDKKISKVFCKTYFDKMEKLISKKTKFLLSELKSGKKINNLDFEGLEKEVLNKIDEGL